LLIFYTNILINEKLTLIAELFEVVCPSSLSSLESKIILLFLRFLGVIQKDSFDVTLPEED